MRSKDGNLLQRIRCYIEEYCDENGHGPTVQEVADQFEISKSTAHGYLTELTEGGAVERGWRNSYESKALNLAERSSRQVAILGAVPCGPLTEMEECIEGYVRLPESFVGKGKFFLLRANGNSMIKAGINDGDMVLIRQQTSAEVGNIIVALVDNEVTLKRLAQNKSGQYYLHPENDRMKDIYVDRLEIQGVAVKIFKDIPL